MSKKQTISLDASTRGRMDSRLVAVAVLLAVLASEVAVIRFTAPMEPQALDAETALVGP